MRFSPDGTLFAVSKGGATGRELIVINPLDGSYSTVGQMEVIQPIAGLAIREASIPEPSTLSLFSLGIVGLIAASRRRVS
jgi:hypothetical protein